MKKNNLKKYLSLILITAALASTCSCQKNDPSAPSDDTTPQITTPENTTDDPSANALLVADKTKGYVKIIRPEDAESYEITAASTLNESIRSIFGSAWLSMLKDDFVKGNKGEAVETDDLEILVGYTNRKESRDTYDSLAEDEYVVKRVNNKIVIIGKNQYATNVAAAEFIKMYIEGKATDSLLIPNDVSISGKCELRKIPIHKDADYRILSYNLGCAVGVAKDAETILLNYLPDIICLQESNKSIHQNVIAKLPDNFEIATKFHANGSTYNYTPIIYNKNLFTLKDSGLEWLDGRYTGTNTKSLAFAVLETKDNKTFAVINFHGAVCSGSYKGYESLTAAERAAQALAWRLDNVRQILELKDRIVKAHGSIPIMVTGDCNFNSDSEPYKNITAAGFAEAEVLAKETTTGYKTSYSYGSISQAASGLSIDHIFMINGIDFVYYNSIRESIAFTASDHLPIYSDFNIAK